MDRLREKLRKLVVKWRTACGSSPALYARYLTAQTFADEVAAILDETEPKPGIECPACRGVEGSSAGEHKDDQGVGWFAGVRCFNCGASYHAVDGRMRRREQPKPLKLGPRLMEHAFQPCDLVICKECHRVVGGLVCGQPREAH